MPLISQPMSTQDSQKPPAQCVNQVGPFRDSPKPFDLSEVGICCLVFYLRRTLSLTALTAQQPSLNTREARLFEGPLDHYGAFATEIF
jgi:hypothetical protein